MTKCFVLPETKPVLEHISFMSLFSLFLCCSQHVNPPELSNWLSFSCVAMPKEMVTFLQLLLWSNFPPGLSSQISHWCSISWSALQKSFPKPPSFYFTSLFRTHLYQIYLQNNKNKCLGDPSQGNKLRDHVPIQFEPRKAFSNLSLLGCTH